MADDGVALSLDDYIKVKRKQGGFKAGRGGPKFRTQQRRRGGPAGGAGRNARSQQQQQRGQQRAVTQGRGRNRRQGQEGRVARNRNGFNVNTGGSPRRGGGAGRGRNRNRQNNQRAGGQLRPLMTRDFGRVQVQRRQQNRNSRGFGISQNLARRNGPTRNAFRVQAQFPQRVAYNRPNNRRVVMKFAKKRVQRARLQLTKRIAFRPNANRRSLMPLLSVSSGVRRTRTGFVTVSNPVERQIQRLVVKEKIQKARQIRMNRNHNFSSSNQSRAAANPQGPSRRQQISPMRNPYQQRPRPTINYQQQNNRASLNHFERSIPSMGRSMYADQEEMMMNPYAAVAMGMATSTQGQWVPPPPLMRTTVNNFYDPTNPGMGDDDMKQALNPDIQRKINFIQNHRNRPVEQSRIMPDFRAPIASSAMKLGDRFKMYMH